MIFDQMSSTFRWKALEKQPTDSLSFDILESLAGETGGWYPLAQCYP